MSIMKLTHVLEKKREIFSDLSGVIIMLATTVDLNERVHPKMKILSPFAYTVTFLTSLLLCFTVQRSGRTLVNYVFLG